jgi:hypothetical protein
LTTPTLADYLDVSKKVGGGGSRWRSIWLLRTRGRYLYSKNKNSCTTTLHQNTRRQRTVVFISSFFFFCSVMFLCIFD